MSPSTTVSILAARPALEALTKRGIDIEPVLQEAQLSRDVLQSVESRLPFESVRRLWEVSATAAHDRSFGVHVAEALPRGAFDVIDYLLSASATVGEGLLRFAQYLRLVSEHVHLQLIVEPRHARLVRRVAAPAPQYDEFALTTIILRSRQASGTQWTPEHVSFQHERRGDDGELARVFGCQVTFGAAETEVRFAPSILDVPHRSSDSRLLAILTRYADSLLTALPTRGDVVASTACAITRQMARALPTLASTAAAVRLPERTLQRRLEANGVNHTMLVDEVRRGLALKYIGDPGLTIGEVAYLLHFADSTAFHRAFRRWTGEAPIQYRRHLFARAGE